MTSTKQTRVARLLAGAGAVVALTIPLLATPAQAAPPANDTPAGAVELTVPGTFAVDTSEATSDAKDRSCVLGHSVWFHYTPASSGLVKMNTVGSTFDTHLALYRGADTPKRLVACADYGTGRQAALGAALEAGRSYWVALSSCCDRREKRGGAAVLNLFAGPATPPTITIDEAESGLVSGRLHVRGTVMCPVPSLLFGNVVSSQHLGDAVARGSDSFRMRACTSEPTSWHAVINSATGWAFQPGAASVEVRGWAYDGFSSTSVREVEPTFTIGTDPTGRPVH
jgi:hypothetical protein